MPAFDNERYLSAQKKSILARVHASKSRLYLEFGGKLIGDLHASRVLPGYDPNVKIRLLKELSDDADIIIVAYGSCSRVSRSAIDKARKEGIKVGMIRPITLWPFPVDVIKKYASKAKVFLSVERSMGQMVDDVRLAIECQKPVKFYGRTGGVIPTPNEVYDCIVKLNKGGDL